ncbi:MAG: glycosyltransferase [Nanoarchaeota archaeon]|nr:glycosyltransferase [Nanoarchaeota archaeon]
MRIQIVSGERNKRPYPVIHDWHHLLYEFEKKGHEVEYTTKSEWPFFYLKYLKFKPDIVICVGVFGAFAAFLKKIRLIRKPIVNDWTDDWAEIMGEKYGYKRIAFLERYMLRNADLITTPSRFREKIARKNEWKVVFRPHGTDMDFTNAKPARLSGKFKIVYAGDMADSKRLDLLVNAVSNLGCELYLIGKPNPKLEGIAGRNVHFLGAKLPDELPSYYLAANVLAITMDNDSSLKIQEYVKSGKPIIARQGRMSNIFKHKQNAYLASDFKKGILELMNDKKLLKQIAAGSRKIRVYSWKEVAGLYLELMQKVYKPKLSNNIK